MTAKETPQKLEVMKSNWVYSLLLLLVVEKIIQHILVTLAFYFNWADIASTVAVSPTILMILGVPIAVLFVFGLLGMIKKRAWAINLIMALALFDMIGEFVAQGKVGIVITVSFLVATLLLILVLIYRRECLLSR
jgi:hypothetical protein